MTVQPGVVWVVIGNGGDGILRCIRTEPIDPAYLDGDVEIPYVPQASLTAALAERDEIQERYGSALSDALQKSTHVNNLMGDVETLTAERDEARAMASAALRDYEMDFVRIEVHNELVGKLNAERDKLAKALGEAVELIGYASAFSFGHLEPNSHSPADKLEFSRLLESLDKFWHEHHALTAQTAQGETTQSVHKSADADTTVLNEHKALAAEMEENYLENVDTYYQQYDGDLIIKAIAALRGKGA